LSMSVIYARCAEQAAWLILLRETAIAGFGQTLLGARQRRWSTRHMPLAAM
jgi:hypothetical protein